MKFYFLIIGAFFYFISPVCSQDIDNKKSNSEEFKKIYDERMKKLYISNPEHIGTECLLALNALYANTDFKKIKYNPNRYSSMLCGVKRENTDIVNLFFSHKTIYIENDDMMFNTDKSPNITVKYSIKKEKIIELLEITENTPLR